VIRRWRGRTAVITGAASGFGLELARLAAAEDMNVVLADLQAEALAQAADALAGAGAAVLPFRLDVSRAEEVEALAEATLARFGVPHLLINNAGIGAGGLIWEHGTADWERVLGVNLMGVAHGVRVFTPRMLAAAQADADYEGHIVNTASMAGLVNLPNMGAYNVSKHAVVSLSETLYQDLALVTDRIGASVLCPYFVPTGIARSARPSADATASQRVAQAMLEKAVDAGKLSAADVARAVFAAVAEGRFYIVSHPQALAAVQQRMDDLLAGRNPGDPFAARPEIGARLRAALRAG
jgi:NAD(P)-dependent dehydrogenase (short-subunit alcohol dehydrogenase family)